LGDDGFGRVFNGNGSFLLEKTDTRTFDKGRITQSGSFGKSFQWLIKQDYFVDAGMPLEDQLTRLKGLLRVLEIWELIKVNVPGLPIDTFRGILLTSLSHVKQWIENESDLDQTFFMQVNLPLSSHDIMTMKTTISER
jgi:hypothetical protein